MSTNRPIVSFEQFLKSLQKLCNDKRSGTLYIVTDKNHAGFLCLQDGAIHYVHYHGHKGDNALRDMANINGVSLRFDPQQKLTLPGSQLFRIEQALKILTGDESATAGMDRVETSPKIKAVSTLSPAIQESLEQSLVEHIGPMASLVCQEVFASTHDFYSVINVLAGRIPSQDKAREFLREAQVLTAKHSSSDGSTQSPNHPENIHTKIGITEGEQIELKKILIEYIGPMADIVCGAVFSNATSLDNAIKQLSVEIPDENTTRQFVDAARKALMEG